MPALQMQSMLDRYGALTLEGIRKYVPDKEPRKYLYDMVLDYPERGGKHFRPCLCIAAGKAFGGTVDLLLNTAITLELLHNAFLIHDDVEDESFMRRNKPAMHEYSNRSIAVNVGDAMNALAISPLLENKSLLGPKLTLTVFREIHHMVLESAEGQAMELGWRKDNLHGLTDDDYLRMILKKTCWYTCIHPIRIGALIATHGKIDPDTLNRLGYFMGVAFQVQDDVLNLVAEEKKYGKEIGGDILEGKRTLMLIHLMQHCTERERKELMDFLGQPIRQRNPGQVSLFLNRMQHYGSIEYAKEISKFMAGAALKEFYSTFSRLPDSEHKTFIESIILYMINREY